MKTVYFLLKCKSCRWWRKSLATDLTDLVEFKACASCSGPRKFKCPKCASIIKSVRVEEFHDDIQEK